MDIARRLVEHLNRDVGRSLYRLPGVPTYLTNPKKGVKYVRGEMRTGLIISFVYVVCSLYASTRHIKEYYAKSVLLSFSVMWIVVINLLALLPKIFVYQKLNSLDVNKPNEQLRIEMMAIFKKRYYEYNHRMGIANICSYLLSIPISIYLWTQNITECFDLLVYSMVYILRGWYSIFRFNAYFLDGNSDSLLRHFEFKLAEVQEGQDRRLLESNTCAICLADYAEGETITEFSCPSGHYFHKECIMKYMETKKSCPMCRGVAGE